MTDASRVRVPTALPALGDLPCYSAKGAGEGEPELISLSQTCQGTEFSGGKAPARSRPYPLWRLPVGVGPENQPTGYYWAHIPFSTLNRFNWKNSNPSYRDHPTKMTDVVMSISATYHPNWADIQASLNILSMKDEWMLLLDKVSEEAAPRKSRLGSLCY